MQRHIEQARVKFAPSTLFWLALLLFAFIPLYPKIPLADVLPGYIVRLRLEDLFVLGIFGIYGMLGVLGRVQPKKNPLFWPILAYLSIGLLSGISAIFLTKTVPFDPLHIGKWAFHWVRRIEYLFLLFLFFDVVVTSSVARSLKRLKTVIVVMTVVVIAAGIYGFGQKYYQWPVYSTMNREFSKGWRLVLTEHARVPSTFAGHYDLGAYLVLALPILLSASFFFKGWLRSIAYGAFVFGYLLLILTASRISFVGYSLGMVLLFVSFLIFHIRSLKFVISWGLAVALFSGFIFLTFGDLSGRFAHLLNLSGIAGYIKHDVLKLKDSESRHYLALTDQLALIADKTDVPPLKYTGRTGRGSTSTQAGREATIAALPPDVYEDIPLPIESTEGGELSLLIASRSYSAAAFTYGLSSAIRFDALWPRAIAGFMKNPLLGSGYSTLTKEQVGQFTEAESTDNDYLRTLGETGLLGFVTFFGSIGYVVYLLYQAIANTKTPDWVKGLFVAVGAGIAGLLVNASYIDVFEASKVAFTFWAIVGATLAVAMKYQKKLKVPKVPQVGHSGGSVATDRISTNRKRRSYRFETSGVSRSRMTSQK